jgi:hypothetical protein|tara:strand:+ start:3073 stop:3498 length:426 start_codon:yes stop_codon:yes gene_type:complete
MSLKFNQMMLKEFSELKLKTTDKLNNARNKIMLQRLNLITKLIIDYVRGTGKKLSPTTFSFKEDDSVVLKKLSNIEKKLDNLSNQNFISKDGEVKANLKEEEVTFIPDINTKGMKIKTIAKTKKFSTKKVSAISQELKKIL